MADRNSIKGPEDLELQVSITDVDPDEAVLVIGRDMPYPDIREELDWDHSQGARDAAAREEPAPASEGAEIRNAKRRLARLRPPEEAEPTPSDVRVRALQKAVFFGQQATSAMEVSVEWLAIDDPAAADEYDKLIRQVAEYRDRLVKRYEDRR